ncbi:MAG: sigma-54 dependent transcriptional regulator [Polyangiaceae bacterium]|jgi:sigma-54-specific transcriptional regulator
MSVLEFSRLAARPGSARALVFESPLSRALLRLLDQIAPTDTTVLVTGSTGTGKEVVARYLHDHSARAGAPFLAVNCGALSPGLLESELFGHERGAFTGALTTRPGWFEAANGGTLFLDEVADLPLAGQVKLLRVLQEREVVRVGGRRAAPVDFRLIAATNSNLQSAVAEGRFREDLFYRLHVAHVALAPLRDRREDILPLARHFLARHAARFAVSDAKLTDEAAEKLVRYDWPGNIRELENVIQRALLAAPQGRIAAEHVRLAADRQPPWASPGPGPAPAPTAQATVPVPPPAISTESSRFHDARMQLEQAMLVLLEGAEPRFLDEVDAMAFRAAYRVANHNQVRTASLLGVSRNIVRARLMRYGLLAADARQAARGRRAEEDAPASQSRALQAKASSDAHLSE